MPPPMSMPVYYSVSGSYGQPVPSTGMFSSVGKQSTATSKPDAEAKVKTAIEQNKLQLPEGVKMWGTSIKNGSFIVEFQNGGKRRKSSKSRSRRNKTRRSKHKKTRRSRR